MFRHRRICRLLHSVKFSAAVIVSVIDNNMEKAVGTRSWSYANKSIEYEL